MKYRTGEMVAVLVSCLLVCGVSRPAPQRVDIAKSGETSLRSTIGGKAIRVTFLTARVKGSDPGFPLALDYYDEVSIIQRMTIVVGGKTVWVPRSVYADLFNTRGASLRSEDGIYMLSIGGADGADTYSVRVYFDGKRVIKRGVYDSFAPEKPSEETRYFPAPPVG